MLCVSNSGPSRPRAVSVVPCPLLPGSNCRSHTNRVTPASTVSSSRCSRSRRSPGGTRAAMRASIRRSTSTSASARSRSIVVVTGRMVRVRRQASTNLRTRSSFDCACGALRGTARRAHAPRRPRRTGTRTGGAALPDARAGSRTAPRRVLEATNGEQRPHEYQSLLREHYLSGAPADLRLLDPRPQDAAVLNHRIDTFADGVNKPTKVMAATPR